VECPQYSIRLEALGLWWHTAATKISKYRPLSETETAFWDRSHIFWYQIAKFQSLTIFQKWDCRFPKLNAVPQPKCKFLRRKQRFRKQRNSETKTTLYVGSEKLLTSNGILELKRKICLWKSVRFSDFPVGRCVPPNLCNVQFSDPVSHYFIEWPMGVAWWRHQATPS